MGMAWARAKAMARCTSATDAHSTTACGWEESKRGWNNCFAVTYPG